MILGSLFVCCGKEDKDPLIAHWRFDEGSGTIALDSSGNGYDGTIQGDPAWVDGISGKALSFDGNDIVILKSGNLLGLPAKQEKTITVWFKCSDASQSTGTILCGSFSGRHGHRGLYIAIDHRSEHGYNGGIYIRSGNAKTGDEILIKEYGRNLDDGNWHQLGIVRDTSGLKIYVDGELIGRETLEFSQDLRYDESTSIGGIIDAAMGNFAYGFKGVIDDVKVYKTALTADQIVKDMESVRR